MVTPKNKAGIDLPTAKHEVKLRGMKQLLMEAAAFTKALNPPSAKKISKSGSRHKVVTRHVFTQGKRTHAQK